MAADKDVIAALRLAEDATIDWEQFGPVAKALLAEAPGTAENSTGGVEVLLGLHNKGTITFSVGAG